MPRAAFHGRRCYNPPHNWQLGWATPLADLAAATLPAGVWQSYTLPAQMSSDANYVRVVTDWANATGANTFFFNFRPAITDVYDSITSSAYVGELAGGHSRWVGADGWVGTRQL